jgi:hypothetical protein
MSTIKTELGEFTVEQLRSIFESEAGKKVRKQSSSEKKAEREKKLEEAKQRKIEELKHVQEILMLSGIELPKTITIKKIGVTTKTETYKDVYINFRFADDVPHILTTPVSGEITTDKDVQNFGLEIVRAKMRLVGLVAKLG